MLHFQKKSQGPCRPHGSWKLLLLVLLITIKYCKERKGEVFKNFASSKLALKKLKFLPKIELKEEVKYILEKSILLMI